MGDESRTRYVVEIDGTNEDHREFRESFRDRDDRRIVDDVAHSGMSGQPDSPRFYMWSDYKADVKLYGEVAVEKMVEDETLDVHDAVDEAIAGSQRIDNYGHMLMTVLLSNQSPECPDYCERWTFYADVSEDTTWSELVREMAYVCFYSDVMDWVKRKQDPDANAW